MARVRLLSTVTALGLVAGCVNPRTPSPETFAAPNVIRVRTDGQIRDVPLEDYVLGSALSELTPIGADASAVSRIFEVQTVLARISAGTRTMASTFATVRIASCISPNASRPRALPRRHARRASAHEASC